MVERQVEAGPYMLTAYERMHERQSTGTLYIEGDGQAYLGTNKSVLGKDVFDPTPVNPVALHLASKDPAANLAYIARPCQYSGLTDRDAACGLENWGAAAYSEQTLAAYNEALNKIKSRYDLTAIHLIGYDSGATLAALLAAGRHDILSLRTVAGNFDTDVLAPHAANLRALPQRHFIGGQDTVTPPANLYAYLQLLKGSECADYTFIQEAEHEKGWVDKWAELLKQDIPRCTVTTPPAFVPIEKPEPIYYPHMGDSKK